MGRKRSVLEHKNLKIYAAVSVGLLLIYFAQVSLGATSSTDVAAINNLHAALGTPVLPRWTSAGGDPCGEAWQGVQCNDSVILEIVLNGANLGGELGEKLGMFASIRVINLSNNHIGGSIPSNLPATLRSFFLSGNQFTGSIPDSVASLTVLTAMSLNNNQLTGEIPDSFQGIPGLTNLDFSSNNLSGQLPPSLRNLITLTTLHLQNNQLSGTIDVLQDLPLSDLNIENNLFAGPIPEKLLSIPNFKKDGNLFNSSLAPVAPPTSPLTPPTSTSSPPAAPLPFWGPPTGKTPGRSPPKNGTVDGPSSQDTSNSGRPKKFLTKKRVVGISIGGAFVFIIFILAILFFMPRRSRRREEADGISNRHQIGAYTGDRENPPGDNGSLVVLPTNQIQKVPKEAVVRPKEDDESETRRTWAIPKPNDEQDRKVHKMAAAPKREDSLSALDLYSMPAPPPPPLPPPPPPVPKVIVKPIVPTELPTQKPATKSPNRTISAKPFTIASLQQHTNSFSPDNLLGSGMLGSVYRAQLPSGKLLAVKKLDKRASSQQKDDEFLDLVNSIDRIRHANAVELMGYCAEHGQRLLIYEYCSNGSLHDALHIDDEFKKKLSWNTRIRMALEAARALEYLHEVCQPPIVHRNFKAANLLLDDDLSVRVSDCGLAPLISLGSVSQLSGQLLSAYGYGAPEFESGIYTHQSDVYSFGVVMLELLTGRKSHDSTRNRGEQFLVRWATTQLHDIDALSRMVDPSLNGQYPTKSLSHFADIISRCIQSEPEFRPPMSGVVQDLLDMIRREPNGSGSSEDSLS
ncbi:protein STRUBBELIG-RECEPTOR FAMILY 3 isoform X2 [Pyrus x bretschneideri]|uniref:protein STRUBBELIG-RECEPTOR FAMILY 3 isoform X2 n=1 Tax=Pyrus x bretschneideri TaxID=225117 RepID=UPI002030425A|nr:protein STRUBBELIG-RECEPTOR FAMILY 3 isoform X2 [Pyrus x bretschneideri]